jgi:hypothetical protein
MTARYTSILSGQIMSNVAKFRHFINKEKKDYAK